MDLDHKRGLLLQLGFRRQHQHHFIHIIGNLGVARLDVEINLGAPLGLEDLRAFRRFKGSVLQINPLQRKLRACLLSAVRGGLRGVVAFFCHGNSCLSHQK